MKYDWLDAYLLQKRGVTKDLQPVWNWVRYHIGGKMFAAVCLDDAGRPYYINLRLEPMNGKVFHAPAGRACPIYACAVNRNHRATCAGCEKLPCEIWKSTRDPQLSDAAFADSIAQRVRNLKGE